VAPNTTTISILKLFTIVRKPLSLWNHLQTTLYARFQKQVIKNDSMHSKIQSTIIY